MMPSRFVHIRGHCFQMRDPLTSIEVGWGNIDEIFDKRRIVFKNKF